MATRLGKVGGCKEIFIAVGATALRRSDGGDLRDDCAYPIGSGSRLERARDVSGGGVGYAGGCST